MRSAWSGRAARSPKPPSTLRRIPCLSRQRRCRGKEKLRQRRWPLGSACDRISRLLGVSDNLPFAGEVGERWLEGLREAGVSTVADRGDQFTAEDRSRTGQGKGPIEQEITVAPPAVAPRLSIVVLPFINLSNDPEQQYFADGITEDLTTDLSRLSMISVISRNTAFTYRTSP